MCCVVVVVGFGVWVGGFVYFVVFVKVIVIDLIVCDSFLCKGNGCVV